MKLSAEDKEDLQIAATFRQLVNSEGWDHYVRILKQRIKEKEEEVLRPYALLRAQSEKYLSAEDNERLQEGNKGAILGLRLALSTPSAIIANADDILSRFKPEERHVVGAEE